MKLSDKAYGIEIREGDKELIFALRKDGRSKIIHEVWVRCRAKDFQNIDRDNKDETK